AHKVSLCNQEGCPYLTVSFDAPLFGLWSPAKKNAPFICIEPWYGRCDKETFEGELSEREWGNKLSPSEEFYTEYTITI
ncbi:MAG: aldose 1-epimerase family protein, partial [Lachnospiraceae bacterium]|nr:aldose 1-epimerase family protein [Lachnospiraceae bacterium]